MKHIPENILDLRWQGNVSEPTQLLYSIGGGCMFVNVFKIEYGSILDHRGMFRKVMFSDLSYHLEYYENGSPHSTLTSVRFTESVLICFFLLVLFTIIE